MAHKPEQTSFIQPHPAALELGAVQALENGVYLAATPNKDTSSPAELPAASAETGLTPREHAFETLRIFALECRNEGHRQSLTNRINTLTLHGEEALARPMQREKEIAEGNYVQLRVEAQEHFAAAIGIPTETKLVPSPTMPDKKIPKVLAKDPEQQTYLDTRYRAFRRLYAGVNNAAAREKVRAGKAGLHLPEIFDGPAPRSDVLTGQQLALDALKAFSRYNQLTRDLDVPFEVRVGLVPTPRTEVPERRPGEATEAYLNRIGKEDYNHLINFARENIWKASGGAALRKSGVRAPEEIDDVAKAIWDDFQQYRPTRREQLEDMGISNPQLVERLAQQRKAPRDLYVKNLEKSVKTQKKLRDQSQLKLL